MLIEYLENGFAKNRYLHKGQALLAKMIKYKDAHNSERVVNEITDRVLLFRKSGSQTKS